MSPDAQDLLVSNLALIERVIAFTCRRQHLDDAEAEEFASIVKLKLVENDFGIVRKFEGRSTFTTFISVVIQRLLLDHRIHNWGKWHTSAEATRLGAVAVDLERLMVRDGRSLDEALPHLLSDHPDLSRESAEAIAAKLPPRAPRRRSVELSAAQSLPDDRSGAAEERVRERYREDVSSRLSMAMKDAIAALPEDDRLILQLRFDSDMTVAQIARALHLDQKRLYRRLERMIREVRAYLEQAGLDSRDVLDVIGQHTTILDFELGKPKPRPSTTMNGAVEPKRREDAP